MSLRQLVKEAKKGLSKALFYFPQEMKTGITPTRLILNSDKIIPLKEGTSVTVNWGGKKVQAEILALDGKESFICSYTNSLLNNLERISSLSYFYITLMALDNNFFMILVADDEGVLNAKDIEWSSKHMSTEQSAVEESQLPADDPQPSERPTKRKVKSRPRKVPSLFRILLFRPMEFIRYLKTI